jgi:hypothetical protein
MLPASTTTTMSVTLTDPANNGNGNGSTMMDETIKSETTVVEGRIIKKLFVPTDLKPSVRERKRE